MSCMVCTAHRILFGLANQAEWDDLGMWHVWETEEVHARFWRVDLMEKDRLDDLGQCFSTAGPRPGTWPWYKLYRAARDSLGIDN